MRLGADGSHLRWRRSGVARYLDGLLHGIADILPDDDRMAVYYNSAGGPPLFAAATRERFVRMPTATLWNQVAVPLAAARDGCDVFVGGANVVPVSGRFRKVLVVHDCIAFRDPGAKPGRDGRYFRRWQRASAARATRVVADSEWTARDCQEYLGIDRDRITVIYPGIDARFAPSAEGDESGRELLARFGINARFVLQVGALERHKGGNTAAGAVRMLREHGHEVELVVCGIPGPRGAELEGARDLGFVDDATLLALYRGAAVVCAPSSHEGFGLPVAEAMACGTPVVAARVAALPEAGGEAALYAEPGDVEGFASALERLLTDSTLRKRHRELGLAQAASFTWPRASRAVLSVAREAVDAA